MEPDKMTILSGIYYHELRYVDLEQVEWVEKLPPMVRLNGFSAFEKGKGVYQEFKDTLSDRKVYVFVDNFEQQKIRLVQKDSSQLFLNLKDSLETLDLFALFKGKIEEAPKLKEGTVPPKYEAPYLYLFTRHIFG